MIVFGKSGHCVLEGSGERGGLYLSSIEYAKDQDLLLQQNIKHVMTVGTKLQIKVNESFIDSHIRYDVYDSETDDIKQFFKHATAFLKEKILEKKENVLVHCHQGASRSATIVIAFLMKCLKWNYDRAYSHIKRIRNYVNPNKGFINQLRIYERELGLAKKDDLPRKHKKSSEIMFQSGEKPRAASLVGQELEEDLRDDSFSGIKMISV